MGRKILLVQGPSFEERALVVLAHLASLDPQAVEVVQYSAAAPDPVTDAMIIVKVAEEQPDLVIFTSTGYDKAAAAVRRFTRDWERPPRIAFISGDEVDLENSRKSGFVTIAADSSFEGYANLSDRAAFLTALGLSKL